MGAPSNSLIANSLRGQGKKLTYKNLLVMKRRNAAILKNRRRVAAKRRPRCEKGEEDHDGITKKVWTLKSLVPNNSESNSNGLEGLFRDTADYILDLQTRVRLMQMMVDALSGCTNNALE